LTRDTRNVLLGAGTLVLLLAASFWATPEIGGDVEPGMVAPDFTLDKRGGGEVTLSSLRGKVVMINFSATWCPPGIAEFPSMQRLYTALEGEEFEMLAVSLDKLGDKVLDEFLMGGGYTMPVLLDPGHTVSAQYGTFRFPETFIVGRDGVVLHKFTGPVEWDEPAAVDYFKKLIAGEAPVQAPEAGAYN